MNLNKKTIKDIDVNGKKVLVRVDFNVPIKDGVISNDNRIVAALPTINYLKNQGAKIVLFSHLGKVKEETDKVSKTLEPIALRLEEKLKTDVKFINETRGEKLETAINNMASGDIVMVENTRFEDIDGKKESSNDKELGKYWASLGDGIFVNDAFGTAHRTHASNVGIASNSDVSVAGLLIEKEIEFLDKSVNNPKRPLVAILGGSKVSDKILVIEKLLDVADYVLIGGGMRYTFMEAMGIDTKDSLVEIDKIETAKKLMEKAGDKLVLSNDNVVNNQFANEGDVKVVAADGIEDGYMALDIGPKSIELFDKYITDAKTVLWNGPMGVFEMSSFANGTKGVCESIARNKEAITIIGGGDSAAAAIDLGYAEDFTHISTGGGASLEFLEGKQLPGVVCLTDK